MHQFLEAVPAEMSLECLSCASGEGTPQPDIAPLHPLPSNMAAHALACKYGDLAQRACLPSQSISLPTGFLCSLPASGILLL